MAPRSRPRAQRLVLLVEDLAWIDGEAAHVVEQAGQLQVLVGARLARELRALERVRELGDRLASVEASRRPEEGVEKPVGHARRGGHVASVPTRRRREKLLSRDGDRPYTAHARPGARVTPRPRR
jgi:hypothetical protein